MTLFSTDSHEYLLHFVPALQFLLLKSFALHLFGGGKINPSVETLQLFLEF
jgi:hypothetical protein